MVERTIKQNLTKLLSTENPNIVTESLLAGAIAMALCYIARIQRTKQPGIKVKLVLGVVEIINRFILDKQ